MRWLRSAVARLLFFLAVALVVASVVATLYGVKLSASYSAQVPSSSVGAAVAVVMPTSSQGVATVNVTGASQVIYLNMGANPITLLPEVHGLGLKVVSSSVDEDLRAGLIVDVTGLQGNPIFVEQAFQGVTKTARPSDGIYRISAHVNSSSFLVIVAVPNSSSQVVSVGVSYRVTNYGRLSTLGAAAAAAALVVVAIAYDVVKG